MKVLFLDIDGVCNSERTFMHGNELFGIDPHMAFLVGKIEIETECKIVLSSSWRHSEEAVSHVEAKVRPLYGKTGRDHTGFRGSEVEKWLKENPGVEKYAILDDDGDFFKWQPLFRTSWKVGLTPDIAEAVINHLNGRIDDPKQDKEGL